MSAVDLSVIVPVYNNAATLDALFDRLIAALDPLEIDYEIVAVDDGSRDRSWAVLCERAARDPRLRPFALVRNFGSQAAACAALDQVRGRRVASLDADLENFPEDLPALLAELDRGYDLVCGYRELRDAPWLTRRLPSRILNAYVRRQTGSDIRDLGCGLKACEAWVVRDLAEEGEARRLLTPLLLRRARRVAQVPVRQGPRHASGYSLLSLFGIALDYFLATAPRPFLISGLLSVAAVIGGTLGMVVGAGSAGLVILTGGLLGILLSLLGEYTQRLYQLSQRVPFYILRDEPEPADGTRWQPAAEPDSVLRKSSKPL